MFTLGDVVHMTGGTLAAPADTVLDTPLSGATTDSRSVGPGYLFIAYRGDRLDGHDFASAACQAGAGALLVQRPIAGACDSVPQVITPDPRASLARLANRVLARSNVETVVGVTGSAGKTTMRAVIGTLLSAGFPGAVLQPIASYNTDTGLSMTILSSLAEQHRFAVLEMGAFRAGDIAALCKLAPPHVGVVTNVGGAHLESFGSLDNTAIAKGELIESLPAHGLAVLNVDDPRVRAMVFRSKAPSVLYGLGDGAQYTGAIDRLTPNGMQFHWRGPYDGDVATSQLIGRHNLRNMLAAIAVAQQCGLDRATIAAGLAAAQPVESRTQIKRAVSGSTIIDDSYNANRASMLAGLDTLRDLAPLDHRWAVLGDMYELGDHAEAEHRAVGAAAAASVGHLYAVGTLARWIAEGAIEAGMPPSRVLHLAAPGDEGFRASPIPAPAVAASRQQLATELLSRLTPADVVLVKAAHGMRLDFVVHLLQAEQPAH